MWKKENIKIVNRLLLESDVIKAVDKHINDDGQIDNDITCILEEIKSPFIASKKAAEINNLKAEINNLKAEINNLKAKNKPVQKQKRVEVFENEDVVLEQRSNRYYLSLYDKEGKFQREVTIDVKDDYKVGLGNGK